VYDEKRAADNLARFAHPSDHDSVLQFETLANDSSSKRNEVESEIHNILPAYISLTYFHVDRLTTLQQRMKLEKTLIKLIALLILNQNR
jgi:hypothetical protein